ncbi:two-component regulator propeller domain-containing protein [Pedobacter sp. N23S346]|uniref:two-component regulator propeller domain-containing protein n=1 Tax=Pedobacter sp. N23S346 TaxID=3402750 RepID=UPI003AC0E1A3
MASDNPSLSYLGIEQGLSNNGVNCIHQDKYGFMWFGTSDGLNRFDGYTFKIFRNRLNDTTSLVNSDVMSIHEDRIGNILVGTKQGASIYNSATGKFSQIQFRSFIKSKGLQRTSSVIFGFEKDMQANVFIATEGHGLLIYRQNQLRADQISFEMSKENRTNYSVQSVKVDQQKRVWLFVQGYGLCLYNYKSNTVQLINGSITTAKCIQPDRQGNIWIGNERGLYQYDIASKSIVAHHTAVGFLSYIDVHNLSIDQKNQLWISTDGGGVTIYDLKTYKLTYLLAGKGRNQLTSGAVMTVLEDKDGRKWIGTLRGGINIVDERKNRFKTVSNNTLDKNGLISNFILSFCEDKSGEVWVGTDGKGVALWNRNNNSFTNYSHQPNQQHSLSNNNIASIIKDHKNDIWMATYGGGVNKFDKSTSTFQYYPCYNKVTKNINQNTWIIYEDRLKNLWVGTIQGGLYLFNRSTKKFEIFDLTLGDIYSIAEDKNGELWVGTFASLVKIDRKGRKHRVYRLDREVRTIYEDNQGDFWVGTRGGGLLLFDRNTGKYKTFTENDGLPGNSLLNILEDNSGNLWISTFGGLSRFNPAKRQFRNFYGADGLQSNQFNYNAALKLKSGELLFGGINGFNIFFPNEIKPFVSAPKLLITDLRINTVPYEQDANFEDKKTVYELEEITIPYDQAVLSVDFTALEYSTPDKISYAYYLEGWDNGWNNSFKVRTISYSKLREGNYKLRIKSTNAEGLWLNNERLLLVKVLPPWWRSWWAYFLYTLAGCATLYIYTLYQKKQNMLRYQIQLAHVKVAQEIELNEKKLSFFTNISHEFRAPLTLIINPIKEFLNSSTTQVDTKDLIVVYRNARRLLSLVDQLLHFRKSDADDLKVVEFNLVSFCKEVYICFTQQAKSRNIQFDFNCSQDLISIFADKEKIEIALFNLVANAFKFTPNGGKIKLSITALEEDVEIHVTDTGSGISKEIGARLFEKFFQVFERGSQSKTGFGIGLYLVKKFIENHSGSVSYTSEPGVGTDFVIRLLKGKAHFNPQFIYEHGDEAPLFLDELIDDNQYELEELSDVLDDPSFEVITEKPTMLVVDDNDEIRNYVKHLFKQEYTIYEADSGEYGLQLVKKHIPDIVITDVVMKQLSGVELCMEIKADPALNHIPVILLTSSSSAEIKLKGIENGADDYITKPFDKDILIARVSNLLKSRSNLQKFFYNEVTLKSHDYNVSNEYKDFLEKCIAISEKHLGNPNFNIKTLTDEIGMSHSVLYKRVKSISGKSVNEFIRIIRLRKVAELFINTDCKVNEAAFEAGFSDLKYFREQFTKLFGLRPSEYIKKYRKPFNKGYKLNGKIVKD